jgi:aminoglycoside phosphotransferase family enzyme
MNRLRSRPYDTRQSARGNTVAELRALLGRRYGQEHLSALQTHFAWVFFTPRRVYKLKKPLCQPPMDYRTVAARRRGCMQELRLNRRLAASVYLGVESLVRTRRGALQMGGPGRVEDYMVRMRRLPRAQMLDERLRTGFSARQLERLVQVLVRFYVTATPRPLGGRSYLRKLKVQMKENGRALQATARVDQAQVRELVGAQRRFLQRAAVPMAARAAFLVDGHGDLRAEHVQIGRSINVIDCLEFSAELRRQDPMQELTQLAMEIERQGSPAIARQLLERYRTRTHEPIGEAEVWFYLSHNAATRAKLAVWHLGDPQFPDPAPWIRRAEGYLGYALRAIRRARKALSGPSQTVNSLWLTRRPVPEHFRQRQATQGPQQGLSQQRSDRQHDEPGIGS